MEQYGQDKNGELKALKENYMDCRMSEEQVDALKKKIRQAKRDKRRRHVFGITGSVAAALAALVILPQASPRAAYAMSRIPLLRELVFVVAGDNFRYDDESRHVDIETPKIEVSEQTGTDDGTAGGSADKDTLRRSAEEINKEIAMITEELISEAKEVIAQETGYEDITVKSEVLNTTEDYFALRLMCYQAQGSGAEWDYFYTIDLKTGKRLALADLFLDDYDYVTAISGEIRRQMQSQMDADDNVMYWLDDPEMDVWNFKEISEDVSFYINEKGQPVICFDEGDVAPMYMGTVEFTITEPEILRNMKSR